MQSVNNKSLIEELDKLLERLRIPSEVFSSQIFMFMKWQFTLRILNLLFLNYFFVPIDSIPYMWEFLGFGLLFSF